MSIIVTTVVMAAVFLIEATVEWFAGRKIHQPEGDDQVGANQIADESLLTETDSKMADETRELIIQLFGDPVTKAIMAMDAKQREEASTKLITQLCGLYHISLNEISYFYENSGLCGGYCHDKNKIQLNIRYLMTNDQRCIKEYLDSIVHELRHAVQWSVLEGNTFWQTPEETQKNWLMNMVPSSNYIKPGHNLRRYMLQPVERDAFTFAYSSLKGVE